MRVEQNKGSSTRAGEVSQAAGAKKAEHAKEKKATSATELLGNPGVRTDISEKAKEAVKAKGVAVSAPDVREDKIAELKKRIADGNYKIDSNAIADKLVDEHLSTASASGA